MTAPGRLLGLDYGLARIGVAVCDANRIVARELGIIERTSKAADFALINEIAEEEEVVGIVVGLPLEPDVPPGTYTQADRIRLWTSRLAAATDLPIIHWDEHLTSVDAEEIAAAQGRYMDDDIDDIAARLILQSYIDALSSGLAPDLPGNDSPT